MTTTTSTSPAGPGGTTAPGNRADKAAFLALPDEERAAVAELAAELHDGALTGARCWGHALAVHTAPAGRVVVTPDGPHRHTVWLDRHVIGTIFDESAANLARGGFAAWSPKAPRKDGIVGFYATAEEARAAIGKLYGARQEAQAAPQWRTLKGVTAPCTVFGTLTDDGAVRLSGDRRQRTGQPITVIELSMRGGLRYGTTSDGRTITFLGTATKVWVIPG